MIKLRLNRTQSFLLLGINIFFIFIFFLLRSLGNDPSLLPSTRIGKPLPTFQQSLLSSQNTPQPKMVSEKDIQGPALLNVWATWCPTCASEHDMLNKLSRQGVKIYGLNYKDNPLAAQKWLQERGDPYLFNIDDQSGQIGIDLGVYGAPETFFINAEGQILHRHVGDINPQNWQDSLQAHYQALFSSPSTTH